jgi:hypothetical protein
MCRKCSAGTPRAGSYFPSSILARERWNARVEEEDAMTEAEKAVIDAAVKNLNVYAKMYSAVSRLLRNRGKK